MTFIEIAKASAWIPSISTFMIIFLCICSVVAVYFYIIQRLRIKELRRIILRRAELLRESEKRRCMCKEAAPVLHPTDSSLTAAETGESLKHVLSGELPVLENKSAEKINEDEQIEFLQDACPTITWDDIKDVLKKRQAKIDAA